MQLLCVILASLVVAAWAQTPAPTSACTGTVAQNTTRCPGLVGAFVPSARLSSFFPNATNFDPDAFYNYLSKELCRCGQLIGKKWICSFIRSMYALAEPACTQPASVTTRLSCRSACEATIGSQNDTALCTAKDIETLPVISCSGGAWIIDSNSGQSANCEKNSAGGDKCTRPPFLNRKTANVPNWFWVILFPLLILIIIVAVVGFFLYRMKHDELAETLNPCKWCECCPGYWDL